MIDLVKRIPNMQILKRLLLPLELYVLLSSFIFTEQFDRNLELDAIGDGSVKDLLIISHGFLDALSNYEHLIGGIFFVYISIVIICIVSICVISICRTSI